MPASTRRYDSMKVGPTSRQMGQRESTVPRREISVRIRPRTTFWLLMGIIGILVALNLITRLALWSVDYQVRDGVKALCLLVDLDFESSLPTWYASKAIFLCGCLLAAIAVAKRRNKDRFARHWAILSFIFFCLSLDESAAIHELMATPLQRWLNTDGLLLFAWIIPGFILVCLIGLAYLRFVAHLEARTRNLFLASAMIYVGGALGLESIAGIFFGERGDSLDYIVVSTLEETCEMVGIAIFAYALLRYLAPLVGTIKAEIEDHSPQTV